MNEFSIKNDFFAVFQGVEYTFVERNSQIILISTNVEDLQNGFREHSKSKFIREVSVDQLDRAYRCTTRGRYNALECQISARREGRLLLRYFQSFRKAEENQFTQVDQGAYEKCVLPEELQTVWYEYSPILGFDMPLQERKRQIW